MPSEPGADNGDSCCHEIGMSLTDECTMLGKPLHGWIGTPLLHLVRGTPVRRSVTVVKIVHLLATRFGQITPSPPRCWSQQSRISAPNSSCGQTSTARHESCSKQTTSSKVSPSVRRACKGKLPTASIACFCPHLESCALPEKKTARTSQLPRVLHHRQLCRCLRWRQKHVGLLCHRKCLARARSRVLCGLLVQCHKAVA